MNEALKRLLEELKGTSGKAKLAAASVLLGVIAIVSIAGVVATRPHYKLLYSGLSDSDSASAQRALAEAGIDYKISQPPAPYFVYVDEAREFEALRAVAASGALERPDRGILSGDGASSVFISSNERAQIVQKRYWQEAEKILESFDFVLKADVRTNTPTTSPFADAKPRSGSVTLKLAPGTLLSRSQKSNVANVVSFYLDVPAERLVVTDQHGESLWSPDQASSSDNPESLLEHAEGYNSRLAERAMEMLDAAYGSGRARVRVITEWDHDRRTKVSRNPGDRVAREEETTKSETPQGTGRAGGVPGTGANLPGAATAPSGPDGVAKNTESRVLYDTGVATEHLLQVGPRLQRLHVSVLVDDKLQEEIGAEHFSELLNVVKTAVGYDVERGDRFEIGQAPFASLQPELDENGKPVVPEGVSSGPSRTVELLLERGVEILAALAFLVVLLRTLRSEKKQAESRLAGSKGRTPSAGGAGGIGDEEQADLEPAALHPEALLLRQVDDLVKNDPERVGKILSRWAREEKARV